MTARDRAWAGLVLNLLVLPGAGSLLVGRKVGWLQAALAIAGFVLTTFWIVSVLAAWIHTETLSLEGGLGLALVGLAAFGAAWVWSLVSSLAEIRRAREV